MKESIKMNLNNLKMCRFCLSVKKSLEHSAFYNIFDVKVNVAEMVERCLNLKITSKDVFPNNICKKCLSKLRKFDEFRNMCRQSRELLKRKADEFEKSQGNCENNRNTNNFIVNPNSSQSIIEEDSLSEKNVFLSASYESSSISNEYVCTICSEVFETFFDYCDHQSIHDGEFVFKCEKCDEVFNKRIELVHHENAHRINCNICQLSILPQSLSAHMLTHTDTHKCPHCGLRNVSNAALQNHIKAVHIRLKGFVCHICGKQNSCQSSMNRHMAYHKEERPYKCKYCDFSAKSLNITQVHTARKHFAEKRVCEICAKIFKSAPSLLQHMKRMHSNRKHACDICNKTFIEKYNLSKHMKKHVGQRLHECKVCQKDFFTVRQLKEHMHSHREGCVSCPTCNKIFFYKKYFHKHITKCAADLSE